MKSPLAPNSAILSSAKAFPAVWKEKMLSGCFLKYLVVTSFRAHLVLKSIQHQPLGVPMLCPFVAARDLLRPLQTSVQLRVADKLPSAWFDARLVVIGVG